MKRIVIEINKKFDIISQIVTEYKTVYSNNKNIVIEDKNEHLITLQRESDYFSSSDVINVPRLFYYGDYIMFGGLKYTITLYTDKDDWQKSIQDKWQEYCLNENLNYKELSI